jgi:hypothetical protein
MAKKKFKIDSSSSVKEGSTQLSYEYQLHKLLGISSVQLVSHDDWLQIILVGHNNCKK